MVIKKIIVFLAILLVHTNVDAQYYTSVNITKADLLEASGVAESISLVGAPITFEKSNSAKPSTFSIYALNNFVTHNSRSDLRWTLNERTIKAGLTTNEGAIRHTVLASGSGSNLVNEDNATFPGGTTFGLWFSIPNVSNYSWYSQRYVFSAFLYDLNSNGGKLVPNRTMNISIEVPQLSETIDGDWAPSWDVYVTGSSDYISGLKVKHPAIKEMLHTIDYSVKLRATESVFEVRSLDNTAMESVPVNVAKYTMGSGTVTLSTVGTTIIPKQIVPSGNKSVLGQEQFTISPTYMKQYFRKAGTYSVPIELIIYDSYTGNIAKKYTRKLTVHVPEISSFEVGSSQVDLRFQRVSDYQQGISKDYADHLVVSQLQPYTISVKANDAYFGNDESQTRIPASAVHIGPAVGQNTDGFTEVSLSTIPQTLIRGVDEIAIDKKYGIKYSIPAAKAQKIISALPVGSTAAGSYRGTITYTMTPQ